MIKKSQSLTTIKGWLDHHDGSGPACALDYDLSYGHNFDDGSGFGTCFSDAGSGYSEGYTNNAAAVCFTPDWAATIPYFVAKWPKKQRARYLAAKKAGLKIAFWRSDPSGQPTNGGWPLKPPTAPSVIHTAPGPLKLCVRGTLHATLFPPGWRGHRLWIVALHGAIVGDKEKLGVLKREILGEAL